MEGILNKAMESIHDELMDISGFRPFVTAMEENTPDSSVVSVEDNRLSIEEDADRERVLDDLAEMIDAVADRTERVLKVTQQALLQGNPTNRIVSGLQDESGYDVVDDLLDRIEVTEG